MTNIEQLEAAGDNLEGLAVQRLGADPWRWWAPGRGPRPPRSGRPEPRGDRQGSVRPWFERRQHRRGPRGDRRFPPGDALPATPALKLASGRQNTQK